MKNPKAKGSGGEREAAELLRGWALEVGVEIAPRRNLEQTRSGGYDLEGIPGLGVEVKRVEKLAIPQWWRQTVAAAEARGVIPVLMYRQNRKPWRFRLRVVIGGAEYTVEMDAEEFKRWFQDWIVSGL